ncbi:hypothetical protein DPX39_100137800 [Trypanosoma brucei equiperdum]|uniref:Uncharacterized protein n=1 Tax=Trypanosoma brucei equiperdum TaxID=630700 RepID=A0A3L6L206_9TRYP|nr:hypothetical protein DPX39_100137800 [Trypanosoma brucei equiperdum]6YXX_E9 Chain E9, mt-LAF29 [Trypanosoma brucei brucei]
MPRHLSSSLLQKSLTPGAARLLPQNLIPQRRPAPGRMTYRGPLLAELDRVRDTCTTEATSSGVVEESMVSNGAFDAVRPAALGSTSSVADEYLVPTPRATKLKKAAMAASRTPTFVLPNSRSATDGEGGARQANDERDGTNSSPQLFSIESYETQQRALRNIFNEAGRHCVRLRKDSKWLLEERRAFRQSHQRAPTTKEVSPHVDVALAPVGALKLSKYLSPCSASREVVEHSLLLHRTVTKSKLVQSSEKTLFRCLRCFHVYAARPRTLLRGEVAQSWLEYEAEAEKEERARQLARRPHLRKKKYSIGRQRASLANDPRCCPLCRSTKAQWMMEYVHHHTHG